MNPVRKNEMYGNSFFTPKKTVQYGGCDVCVCVFVHIFLSNKHTRHMCTHRDNFDFIFCVERKPEERLERIGLKRTNG